MIPVNKLASWPDEAAPHPPGSPSLQANNHTAKADTLESVGSNVYEDLESSSDDGQSTGTLAKSDDVYSDYLDETFADEDDAKGLIFNIGHDYDHIHMASNFVMRLEVIFFFFYRLTLIMTCFCSL